MPWINKQIIQSATKVLSVTAKNTTGSAISVGKVVYITGSQGSMATIALSDKDMEATSSKTFWLVSKNVANNGTVEIITKGKYKFNGLDTTALTEGTSLWLWDDGNLLQSPPAEPAHTVFIGYLEIKGNNSTIIVDIQNWYELNELHGVEIANEQDGQALVYEASTGLWKNQAIETWWITSWTFQVDFWNNTNNNYSIEVIVPETNILTNSKPAVQYYDPNSRDSDESEFINFVTSIVSVTNWVWFTVQITDNEEWAEWIYNFSYQF